MKKGIKEERKASLQEEGRLFESEVTSRRKRGRPKVVDDGGYRGREETKTKE